MKIALITIVLLASTNLYAGTTIKCRDRGNFMSSWYELIIEKSFYQINGSLHFQTAEGSKKLTSFSLPLKKINYYGDKDSSLKISSLKTYDALEFRTNLLERPFKEGFKCQKKSNIISRSFWNTAMAARVFHELDTPIHLNNGGFREIRRAKKFETDSFSLVVDELGHNKYSLILKVDPNAALENRDYQQERLTLSFNQEDSLRIQEAFKDLFDENQSLNLKEIKTTISCLDLCQMVLN